MDQTPKASFEEYIDDVQNNRIVTGELVKRAIQRHINDLKTAQERGFYFDRNAAIRACELFPTFFRHSKGAFGGHPLKLMPWQSFIIAMLFGWKCVAPSKLSGKTLRRFRRAYIEVARKNGKSTLMAGLALMLLLFDREPGARVYLAATGLEQTMEVWEPIVDTLRASPALRGVVKVFNSKNNHRLEVFKTNSVLRPIHGDATGLDGLNVSGAIIDELHRHPTPKLWEVLDSATSAREQPLIAIITTAGENQNSVCYERHNYIQSVLNGGIDDDAWFGFIAAIDDGDKWDDEAVWEKANPNIRYIPTMLDDLRSKVKSARNSTAERINFFIKHTCRWVTSATAWLKVEDWDRCRASFTYDQMKQYPDGLKRPAFAAFDLADTMDLTAVCLCFPPVNDGDKWRYMWRFFLPQTAFDTYITDSKYPWRQWHERGELEITAGSIADHQNVRKVILQWASDFDLKMCGHDRYHARQLVAQLEDDGIPMVELPQGYKLCEASKQFETLVRTATMEHNGEGIMRWQADNAAVKSDGQGNFYPIRPQKNLNDRKIDGIIAAVMACEVAQRVPVDQPSIYACLN